MTTCKYFGVRTSERENEIGCRKCKEADLELFRKCTIETNILMGTSIDVDDEGNTISIPPKVVSDSKLMYEKFEDISLNAPEKEISEEESCL